MTEQWRDIEGWHGRFEVSDQGRVRFTKDNRILPQTQVKGGWLTVYLFHNAKRRWPRVHTLVADAFIANPMNLPCVSHKNGDRTDNRLENLERTMWVAQGREVKESDHRYKPVPGIEWLECTYDGDFRYKGKPKALRSGFGKQGQPLSVQLTLMKDKRQYHYQAARLVAATWLRGFEDSDYITYDDGDCHNIRASNLTIADKREYYEYMQRNSGNVADGVEERKRKLQLVADEALMTKHYFETLRMDEINRHVQDYLYPCVVQYAIKTLQMGEQTAKQQTAEAIARMYEVIMAGMCLYNYERYLKKLLHNYKKTGSFGYTAEVPKAIKIEVQQLNLDCLWERFKVTHFKK